MKKAISHCIVLHFITKLANCKLQMEHDKEVAMYEECLTWAKKAEADLMQMKTEDRQNHEVAIDKLIAEHQKAEVKRLVMEQREQEACERAQEEALQAELAATEAKLANEALDTTSNGLMKCMGDLQEGTFQKK